MSWLTIIFVCCLSIYMIEIYHYNFNLLGDGPWIADHGCGQWWRKYTQGSFWWKIHNVTILTKRSLQNLPCTMRLNQLVCNGRGESYPGGSITTFVGDNKVSAASHWSEEPATALWLAESRDSILMCHITGTLEENVRREPGGRDMRQWMQAANLIE